VPAGLAQEELERVGGRLDGAKRGVRLWNRIDQVDAALFELPVEEVRLEQVETLRLDQLVQLGLPDETALSGPLDQLTDLVELEDAFGYRRHPIRSFPLLRVRNVARRSQIAVRRAEHGHPGPLSSLRTSC
jgi:hypothetical protein